jgi:hypothetical protein
MLELNYLPEEMLRYMVKQDIMTSEAVFAERVPFC